MEPVAVSNTDSIYLQFHKH